MNFAAYTQVASVTVYASVDEGARDAFFAQLSKYAETHIFQFRIDPVEPDGKHFAGDMWRRDLRIFVRNPFDPRVAMNRGLPIPQATALDSAGNPTRRDVQDAFRRPAPLRRTQRLWAGGHVRVVRRSADRRGNQPERQFEGDDQ